MKALIWDGTATKVVSSRPPPSLRDDYILVKTVTNALNPTDCKAIRQGRAAKDGLIGSDFAGIVEEIGYKVNKPWKKGDRVCGLTHGANSNNPEDGAFAEIIAAKGDLCMRIPEHISFEEICTLPVAVMTAGQGLFQGMRLNLPDDPIKEKDYILIYGGSSSCGLFGIQLASLSVSCRLFFDVERFDQGLVLISTRSRAGYSVVATCSARNFHLCKSRGAEGVFDYNDPECARKIQEYTNGDLCLAWDTIGSEQGVQTCMNALSTKPGATKKYGTILFNSISRQDVIYSSSFLATCFGEAFSKFGKHTPASPEDFQFAKTLTGVVERLVAEGRLQAHPAKMCAGGLQGIMTEGVQQMLEGKVSGSKLVYRIADTL